MRFVKLDVNDRKMVEEMSILASAIVKEHYDPLIGAEQNDYMIAMFQSAEAITDQLNHGYQYYFFMDDEKYAGFIAFYEKEDSMYLSKFYLSKEYRGKGYSKDLLSFVKEKAKEKDLPCITLNVNKGNPSVQAYLKLGSEIIRKEVNDIGNGFVMDDYVMAYQL